MEHVCKRCLLLEAGEKASYDGLQDYLKTVDDSLKVSADVYRQRLSVCRSCDQLISGMCVKCGCYAELRAAFKNKECADYNDIKWNKA